MIFSGPNLSRCCRVVATLWMVVALSACGQIGPLYLPEKATEPPAAENVDEEREESDDS